MHYLKVVSLCFVIIVLTCVSRLLAQTSGSTLPDWYYQLDVNASEGITELLKKQTAQRNPVLGYRIVIYFSSSANARKEAEQVKSNFLSNYGGQTAYLQFASPDFKVKVGNFRTRSEVLKFLNTIKRDYPNAFIIQDNIQIAN